MSLLLQRLMLHFSEPYSLREAKFHLRHIRELLNALDFEECHLGTEGHSLSYLNLVTLTDVGDGKCK